MKIKEREMKKKKEDRHDIKAISAKPSIYLKKRKKLKTKTLLLDLIVRNKKSRMKELSGGGGKVGI